MTSLLKPGEPSFANGKNTIKGQVSLVFRASRNLDRDQLEEQFKKLPDEVRGVVDWEIR